MHSKLVLISGYAASGKSRVARQLVRRLPGSCFLDKDSLTSRLADRLLVALGQPAGDRDSEIYRSEVRHLEYECLIAAGLETAELRGIAVLCAPFLAQLVDPQWMTSLQRELRLRDLRLRIVWVHCDAANLHKRMIQRRSPRDQVKLADWPAYLASIDVSLHQRIQHDYHVFDNSDEARFGDEMDRLIDYVSKNAMAGCGGQGEETCRWE